MGQAQSMSSGGSGCEDCVNYLGSVGLGERGVQPSPVLPGSYPGGIIPQSGQPGMQFPSYIPGTQHLQLLIFVIYIGIYLMLSN